MSAFRCSNAKCDARGPVDERDHTLVCRSCGQPVSPRQGIRPYARITGQWIVGGTTLLVVGLAGMSGSSSPVMASLGGTALAYAVFRVIHQAVLLKRFK